MAEDFCERSCREFSSAAARADVPAVRDSAEKVWNAVVQAVNALVRKYMERIPLSRFERREDAQGDRRKG